MVAIVRAFAQWRIWVFGIWISNLVELDFCVVSNHWGWCRAPADHANKCVILNRPLRFSYLDRMVSRLRARLEYESWEQEKLSTILWLYNNLHVGGFIYDAMYGSTCCQGYCATPLRLHIRNLVRIRINAPDTISRYHYRLWVNRVYVQYVPSADAFQIREDALVILNKWSLVHNGIYLFSDVPWECSSNPFCLRSKGWK